MALRRERIVIEVEDNASREYLKAAVGAEAFEKAVDGIGSSSRRVGPEVDRLSGRIRIIADTLAILGPGIAPIGAVAIPAVTGLATALSAVAIAGGGALVAFQGVGDAVEAVQKAHLEPTVENLEAAREAVSQLGPHAAKFVTEFQKFRPVLTGIRDAAAEGLFPGITQSLDDFERLAPRLEELVLRTNQATGQAIADGAESLASDRWSGFLKFLEVEMPAAITSLSKIVGDLAHGAALMWQEFDVANDGFLRWMEGVADGFDRWAASAEGRESIAEFLAYVRETGPQVAAFFTSLVDSLTQIAQAAAPLGGIVLSGLTSLLDVVARVADSDIGTPIMAGVAALALYNRTLQATATLSARVFGTGPGAKAAPAGSFAAFARDAKAARPSLQEFGTWARNAGQSAKYASEQTKAARANVHAFGRSFAGAAAPMAGMAVLSSGVADGFELQSTASLALMGAMVGGVPGAVAGGLVGAYLDVSSATGKAAEAIDRANQTLAEGQGSIESRYKAVADLRAEAAAYQDDVTSDTFGEGFRNWFDPDAYVNDWRKLTGQMTLSEEMAQEASKLQAETLRIENSFGSLAQAMGAPTLRTNSALVPAFMERTTVAAGDMQRAMEASKPAMDALGISVEEYTHADPRQLAAFNSEILRYINAAESQEGRTSAVGGAIKALGNDLLSTSEKASALEQALNNLLSPTLNVEAATDQWRQSVKNLRNELDASAGFEGNSNAAIANRELTRTYIEDTKQRLVLMAEAGASEREIAAAAQESRQAFIESGIAAGLSREEIRARANELELTPKLVKTIFEAAGIDESTAKARTAIEAYRSLPANVRTELQAEGIPRTVGQVNALVAKYELTERQRKALITLMDNASPGIKTISQLLDAVGRKKPRPTITAETAQAVTNLGAVLGMLSNIRSKTVTVTTLVQTVQGKSDRMMGGAGSAAGGTTVPKDGRAYYDRFLYMLAPGEEVVSNSRGQADRFRPLLKAINNAADGDTVGGLSSWRLPTFASSDPRAQRALEYMSESLDATTRRLILLDSTMERSTESEKRREEKRMALAEKAVASQESLISTIDSSIESLASTTRDKFAANLWGTPTEQKSYLPENFSSLDPAAAAAWYATSQQLGTGPMSRADRLDEQSDRLRGYLASVEKLDGLNLPPAFLREILNNASPEEIAELVNGSRSVLRDLSRSFGSYSSLLQRAGRAAGSVGYGDERTAELRELRELKEEVRELRQDERERERREEKRGRDNAKETGREVANGIDARLVRSSRGGGPR